MSKAGRELRMFVRFCVQAGALTECEATALRERAAAALTKTARAQSKHLQSAEPAGIFMEHLGAALRAGDLHIVERSDGERPVDPDVARAVGWRGSEADGDWRPGGPQVGWVDVSQGFVYLDPAAVFGPIVQRAGDASCRISVGKRTLWKALVERGFVVSHDHEKHTKKLRVGKRTRNVLHLRLDDIAGTTTESNESEPTCPIDVPCSVPGAGRGFTGKESSESPGFDASEKMDPAVPCVPRIGKDKGPVEPRCTRKEPRSGDEASHTRREKAALSLQEQGTAGTDDMPEANAEDEQTLEESGRPQPTLDASKACYCCGHQDWWRPLAGGEEVCERCHACPYPEDEVERWGLERS